MRKFDQFGNEITEERVMKTVKTKTMDYTKQAALKQVTDLVTAGKLELAGVDEILAASEKIADWMTTEIEQPVYDIGCGCGSF